MKNMYPSTKTSHSTREAQTPEQKFLDDHRHGGKCPFGCDKNFDDSEDLLSHVYNQPKQTDEHLLTAAQAGLFARDFAKLSISETEDLSMKITGDLKVQEPGDSVGVPVFADKPSSNAATDGDFEGVARSTNHRALLRRRLTGLGWAWAEDEQDEEDDNKQGHMQRRRPARQQAQALQFQVRQQSRAQQFQLRQLARAQARQLRAQERVWVQQGQTHQQVWAQQGRQMQQQVQAMQFQAQAMQLQAQAMQFQAPQQPQQPQQQAQALRFRAQVQQTQGLRFQAQKQARAQKVQALADLRAQRNETLQRVRAGRIQAQDNDLGRYMLQVQQQMQLLEQAHAQRVQALQ